MYIQAGAALCCLQSKDPLVSDRSEDLLPACTRTGTGGAAEIRKNEQKHNSKTGDKKTELARHRDVSTKGEDNVVTHIVKNKAYPRKVAPTASQQAAEATAVYVASMKAHFHEVRPSHSLAICTLSTVLSTGKIQLQVHLTRYTP